MNKTVLFTFGLACLLGTLLYKTVPNNENSDMMMANVEALSDGESGQNYNICYFNSKVAIGYTYYDCGKCEKVYDERGRGQYSKCFH